MAYFYDGTKSKKVLSVVAPTLKKLLDTTKNAYYLFYNYQGTSINGLIGYNDTENVTQFYGTFYRCANLTTIPLINTGKANNMSSLFWACTNLKIVPALDLSTATSLSSAFAQCSNLEEIHATGMKVSFNISASTKFTESALVEILNNLATITSSQTLTMGSTNLAKLSSDEIAIATDKGWTLA